MISQVLEDLASLARVAGLGLVLALGPLAWVWLRQRGARPAARLRSLTALTLFLTFDLVLFGAFTRLSDSGLGCPDWPGCYGSLSPIGASHQIDAAAIAMPTGPVTRGKAWIEMTHRYLASSVGVLILVLAVASWIESRRGRLALSPWWATATLGWVCLQGAFGALTVTMRLYPAIVTVHLLGGLGLLALLAIQSRAQSPQPALALSPRLRIGVRLIAALVVLQIALGGWVSANYAVLACRDFPLCQGSWWPAMDFSHGFAIARDLGAGKDGGFLPFAALTAIHYVHRLGAYVVLGAVLLFAWGLRASGDRALRGFASALMAVATWQLASGLSNVVFGWPLVAAIAHTGGAAALVTLLAMLMTRTYPRWRRAALPATSGRRARAAS